MENNTRSSHERCDDVLLQPNVDVLLQLNDVLLQLNDVLLQLTVDVLLQLNVDLLLQLNVEALHATSTQLGRPFLLLTN